MKCSKCGTELKVGCVYCPKCGKEMQVSDSTLLEDDFLSDLLEEEKNHKTDNETGEKTAKADSAKKIPENDRKKGTRKSPGRKFSRKKKILVVVVCLICIAAVLGGILCYMKMNSFSSLYRKAEIKYNTGMYEDAREILDKAMRKEPDSQNG